MEENEKREVAEKEAKEKEEKAKKEKEAEEREEEARRQEKERYRRRIEEEEINLKKFREIQTEVDSLNDNLNACINVVSDSIINIALRKRYETMRQTNRNTYMKANREVGAAIEEKEKTISKLQDEKEQLEEQEKKEKENYSNE